jgi:hypothetical protein
MAINKIFKTFDTTDIVSSLTTEITNGLWSGDTGSLSAAYTSSAQSNISGEYYLDVYNKSVTDTSAEVQFSVAYGHISGAGSPSLANLNTSTLPTQANYSQYKNILLPTTATQFQFGPSGNAVGSDDIYIINIQRSRLRQTLDPGNWQVSLSGSKGVYTFIDDSGLSTATVGNTLLGTVYNVRSGSIAAGVVGSGYYGLVFPDAGVIIMQPSSSCALVGMPFPNTGFTVGTFNTSYQSQHGDLYRAISGSMVKGNSFIARSAENIASSHYFVRLRNDEFNYSNNPTYYSGSTGQINQEAFRYKPTTYATTIGLYNSTNELLAVAKLSKPLQKSTDREALVRVRLDY